MSERPAADPAFVHLRVHSEYSLVDGVVRIKPLVAAAREQGMPALAVTDHANLFGLVRFYQAALKAGIKPIAGADLWLDEGAGETPSLCTLLCQDLAGYRNLSRLLTLAYQQGQQGGQVRVQRAWVAAHAAGLIALSGAAEGDVGRGLLSARAQAGRHRLDWWRRHFDDRFYLELRRTGRPDEDEYLHAAVALAAETDTPVVATNDVRFLAPADFEAHEVRVCINSGRTLADPRRPRQYSPQQYLRSPAEMAALFADLPEALENSVEIAKRCNLGLTLGENFLPDFPLPPGRSVGEQLRDQAGAGLQRRLAAGAAAPPADYAARLAHELDVIEQMGFPGYFLIVADFIGWARENDVPVGPGRGSGAGSLVAYALGITDLDPLAHELLFERFLNPERVSMPDFDIDFCMAGRDRVIDYVADRYGRDRVSQIITFGTMAAKAVVRDVGRVLGHPYGFVDRIAKLIPFELGMTLDKALAQEPELRTLYESDEAVQALIDLARALEGLARNAGKHAGGVVIAPGPLTDFAPLYCEPGGASLVTQFDKDDAERIGLVKFDFLGLRTLTIIDWAVKQINRSRAQAGEPPLVLAELPMDDPAAYTLLKAQQTTAVFQLESRGMKDLIKRLQPDCFEDIVALVALFRPGPLQSGMVDDFINRKHGRAAVEYPHPALEPVLRPTYGVILYQEQVMQIAQVLAGYTLGGADLLRRAMGKKKPEEMAKQREIFTAGAEANGVGRELATYIFDLMEKFAGYGFNKSHSAAYALLSYQTAWLKAHYPAHFMAAVLSADMEHTDKIVTLIDECEQRGLTVEPPDVNASDWQFTARDATTLRYGLGAIKGVGEGAIEGLLAERAAGGPFADLFSLCRRGDARRLNRRVLEALIRAGALDGLGANRATLAATVEPALRAAEQSAAAAATGQEDLFGVAAGTAAAPVALPATLPDWPENERLQGEKETLGLYLSGHPILAHLAELAQFTDGRISEIVASAEGRAGSQFRVLAGLVVSIRRQAGKRAFLVLDDRSARIELTVFEEQYQQYRSLLVPDQLLIVEGNVSFSEFTGGYRVQPREILDLPQARERYAGTMLLAPAAPVPELATRLEALLAPHRGGRCAVRLHWPVAAGPQRLRAALTLGEDWRVHPRPALLEALGELLGEAAVQLRYRRPAPPASRSGPPRRLARASG